jgi:hypothetical protein
MRLAEAGEAANAAARMAGIAKVRMGIVSS